MGWFIATSHAWWLRSTPTFSSAGGMAKAGPMPISLGSTPTWSVKVDLQWSSSFQLLLFLKQTVSIEYIYIYCIYIYIIIYTLYIYIYRVKFSFFSSPPNLSDTIHPCWSRVPKPGAVEKSQCDQPCGKLAPKSWKFTQVLVTNVPIWSRSWIFGSRSWYLNQVLVTLDPKIIKYPWPVIRPRLQMPCLSSLVITCHPKQHRRNCGNAPRWANPTSWPRNAWSKRCSPLSIPFLKKWEKEKTNRIS